MSVDFKLLVERDETFHSFPLTPGLPRLVCKLDGMHQYEYAKTATGLQKEMYYLDHPNTNVGAACYNLWVVDLDMKGDQDGVASLQRVMEEQSVEVPRTWVSKTKSGGWHIWFSLPSAKQQLKFPSILRQGEALRPGVDLRTGASHVVYPGSGGFSTKNGVGRYDWVSGRSPYDSPLLGPPDWMCRWLDVRKAPDIRAAPRKGGGPADVQGLMSLRVWRPSEVKPGARNPGLNSAGAKLLLICRNNGGDPVSIAEELVLGMNESLSSPLGRGEAQSIAASLKKFAVKMN